MTYQATIENFRETIEKRGAAWNAIDAESAARMQIQNRFPTGLDIAKHTAKIMRSDMDAYDADTTQYTQSLGCWHGFYRPTKNDFYQEALWNNQTTIPLFVGLDGCSITQ